MKRVVMVVLAASLVACGPGRRHQAAPHPSQAVAAPNFADLKPHPDVGTVPRRYPVHGIDLSRYQPNVDWPTARANGVSFAFIKATEGGDGVDPLFDVHWTNAERAGVRRGAYHLFYHCRPAIQQARWFIAHVPRSVGALPPVLDMEWTPTSPTCRTRRAPAEIRAEARVYLNAVGHHFDQQPILYTTPDFFHDNDLGQLTGVTFWLRSVAAAPRQAYPGQAWTFWQYSGTGVVPGVAGKVDVNAFAGSNGAWAGWLKSNIQ